LAIFKKNFFHNYISFGLTPLRVVALIQALSLGGLEREPHKGAS